MSVETSSSFQASPQPLMCICNCWLYSFIHSVISGMHHCECVAPDVDINLQSGPFGAMSIASFRERFISWLYPLLQCFVSVDCVTERHLACKKPTTAISKGAAWNKPEKLSG